MSSHGADAVQPVVARGGWKHLFHCEATKCLLCRDYSKPDFHQGCLLPLWMGKKMSHSDTQGELPAPINETQKDSWLPSVSAKHQHADHRVPLQNIKYTVGWFSCDQTESFLGQDHTRHPVNFTIKDYARASDRTTHHSSTKTHLS